MKKRIGYVILVRALVLLMPCVFFIGCNKSEVTDAAFEEGPLEEETVLEESVKTIFVQLTGEVKNPGVYEVKVGSRVFQVIEQAGGLTKEASLKNINQAAIVEDEQEIYVYSRKELKQLEEAQEQEESSDGKINLNRASKEELMTLPGIGQSKAELIVQYREETGKFSNINDIMKINGIKEGVFQKVKDYITV